MGKKVISAWLPTPETWADFLAECGDSGAVADGDRRVSDHAGAVEALVALLRSASAKREKWLILSTPAAAMNAAPGVDLRTQKGRATAATRLAERCDRVLGLKVAPDAIGWALLEQGHYRWRLEQIAEHEGGRPKDVVRVFRVVTTSDTPQEGGGDERGH